LRQVDGPARNGVDPIAEGIGAHLDRQQLPPRLAWLGVPDPAQIVLRGDALEAQLEHAGAALDRDSRTGCFCVYEPTADTAVRRRAERA
jgi:hypothetical protein